MAVTFRNVNLRWECQFVLTLGMWKSGVTVKRALREEVGVGGGGGDNCPWRLRKGRTARLSLNSQSVRTWPSQVQKQVLNAADGWRL